MRGRGLLPPAATIGWVGVGRMCQFWQHWRVRLICQGRENPARRQRFLSVLALPVMFIGFRGVIRRVGSPAAAL